MPESDTDTLTDMIIRCGMETVEEVEVFTATGTGISADLKRSVIGVAEVSRHHALGIRVIDRGHTGTSGTDDPSRWQECLGAAIASARLTGAQKWEGLPEPAPLRRDVPSSDPDLLPEPALIRRLIDGMLEGASAYEAEVTGGSAGAGISEVRLANSHGIRYAREQTHVSISLEAIKKQSTGYESGTSVFLSDIDPMKVGEQAAFFASHSVDGVEIRTGEYDIILSPIAAANLLSHVLLPSLSGRSVKAGRSYLADKLGEECMDECLSIYDDPFATGGIGCTAWDAEGMPTKRLDFVKNGVLECFAYDLKTAYRYDEVSTASAVRSGAGGAPAIGVHNLVIDGERSTIDDEPAIYIHDVVGAHTANQLTGDFSVEVSNPILVEGGEFGEPVRKAMYAGNVFEMLRETGGLGSENRVVGRMILPAIRLNKQHIIGN